MNLEPLRRALRAETVAAADRRRSEVTAECERIVAEAEASAHELSHEARVEGERAAAREASRRHAAAARRARETRLAAQRSLVDELRRRAREAVLGLRELPDYPDLLERLVGRGAVAARRRRRARGRSSGPRRSDRPPRRRVGGLHAAGAGRPDDRRARPCPGAALWRDAPAGSTGSAGLCSRSRGSLLRCSSSSRSARRGCPARSSPSGRAGDGSGLRVHGRCAPRRSRCRDRPPAARRRSARACSEASSTGCCGVSRGRTPCSRTAPRRGRSTRHVVGRSRPSAPWATRSRREPSSARCRRPRRSCSARLVPFGLGGTLEWIAPAGAYTVTDPVARVSGEDVCLATQWPVRRPRPVAERLRRRRAAASPASGSLDLLFPVARGSTRRGARAASAPARPCCCSRSRSGATPT